MKMMKLFGLFMLISVLSCGMPASAQQKMFTLTKQDVGCVKMGMKYSQLPAKCDGLYTHFKKVVVENEMDGNYTQYVFYNGAEKVMSSDAYYDAVKNLTTYTPRVKAANGMYAGMSAVELYNHRAKVNTRDLICFEVGGYQFTVSELSASGSKKVNDEYATGKKYVIAPTDFVKGAEIETMTVWVD